MASRFYGCYLLTSLAPRCKNHTYIGFTVNPVRRLKQHNGMLTNGAKRTSRKRPWEMVMLVFGFPSKIAALQFEFAWQKPDLSKRTKAIASRLKGKCGNAQFLKAKLMLVHEMLNVPPWNRFPLILRWISSSYEQFRSECIQLPPHIEIQNGAIEEIKLTFRDSDSEDSGDEEASDDSSNGTQATNDDFVNDMDFSLTSGTCTICRQPLDRLSTAPAIHCPHKQCSMAAHFFCISEWFLSQEAKSLKRRKVSLGLIPTKGTCPSCSRDINWGSCVRQAKKTNSTSGCEPENRC
eukprot:GCRY01005017.1.p1 GENE.GCRY01005017.1~~GCRY01005017.1.p1  ORF type:complete len:293 (-),score=21.84 GCRY01005017.1:291-1169(-)